MKKYLMRGIAAAVFCGAFTSCSHDMDLGSSTVQTTVQETYEKAFITHFGEPASTQTWGFGSGKAATRGLNNPECPDIDQPYDEEWVTDYLTTAKEPNSANIIDNYNDSHDAVESVWVKTGEHWVEGQAAEWVVDVPASVVSQPTDADFRWVDDPVGQILYSWGSPSQEDKDFFNNTIQPVLTRYNNSPIDYSKGNNSKEYVLSINNKIDVFLEMYNLLETNNKTGWITVTTWPVKGEVTEEQGHWTEATEGHMEEDGYWTQGQDAYVDETYVTNFKITGTYSGQIGVAASEGSQTPGCERTIVVTGTWNITTVGESSQQRIGSLGKVIIADGGTINVAEGVSLHFVNQARLVVLPGGRLTGSGSVEVNNGTAEGLEDYNGGTIDVAHFNNNFGKFYNYGKFLVNEYDAGATESNFYNHGLVNIDHTGNTPNARIFNNCQFYVQNDARLRNYEGVNGSALIVGGQLMPFGSEDGTTLPSFVCLAAGALVKCGSLYNGASWIGPTEGGYAALEIVDQIDYLTWVQDSPQTAGYFANNIYVKCGTWENDPTGQGKHYDGPINTDWDKINYDESRAEYKFWSVAANCTGNGNVTKVTDSDHVVWPADDEFQLGVKGCTPGFKGDIPEENPPVIIVDNSDEIVVLAEDLTIDDVKPDFDFNDVVFKVTRYTSGEKSDQVWVTILAAGGTLPLTVDGHEVHAEFAEVNPDKVIVTTTMINTAENAHDAYVTPSFQVANPSGSTIEEIANNIAVVVTKFGEPITLTAPTGGVPAKIAVKTDFLDYGWCDERQDIDERFNKNGKPLFKSYVRGELDDNWYTNLKTSNNQ